MKLTKDHLKKVQLELFYSQLDALHKEEKELLASYNTARNLACSEWEYGDVPTRGGGMKGLRTTK